MKNGDRFLHLPSKRLYAITQCVPGNPPSFLLATADRGSPDHISATMAELCNLKLWAPRSWITLALPAALEKKRLT
jgi:hypothetical protein